MAGYGGIGSLPQTRDLFTAPGSLLGYDPYFQDAQRFQEGGLGTTAPVSYESLQAPAPDLYGANRTVAERARSFDLPVTNPITGEPISVDPLSLAGTAGGYLAKVNPAIGIPLGLARGAYGVYQDLSEAEKMRAGILPPETYETLGLLDKIATVWPEWLGGRSYEDALTDEDVATLSQYGLAGGVGGDVGGEVGQSSLTDPRYTQFAGGLETTRLPGPRFTDPRAREEYEAQVGREQQYHMMGWMSNLSNQIATNRAREFQTQRSDPLRGYLPGARVYTEDLPPVSPQSTVTVEDLAPVPTLDELGAWTGGFDWATGDNGATGDPSGFGVGGDEGLGY